MYQKQTIVKYLAFLNEAYEMSLRNQLYRLGTHTKKHHVSSAFATYLIAKGWFERKGKGVYWCTAEILFDEERVINMVDDFNAWQKEKKDRYKKETRDASIKTSTALECYSTQELMNELKARGYSGTLTVKKEITF